MSEIYQQWVSDNQDHAWSLAKYILKDPSEAEDVVQEAFIKLWSHQDNIDPLRVTAWLMTVTRRLCFDRLRKRRPNETLSDQEVDPTQGPTEQLQNTQLKKRLTDAVNQLKEPYRSMIILRDLQQLSYEVIATTTNMSLSQVKTNLHRARKHLREHLQELKS